MSGALNGHDVAEQGLARDGCDAALNGDPFSVGGGAPKETWQEAVKRLAKLPPIEFDRVLKAEADKLGARSGTLDAEVKKARGGADLDIGQGRKLTQERPEVWPKRVDGAQLLADIAEFLTDHVFLPPGAADAGAGWVLHTFCFERFRHTPRLGITSAVRRCGKSTLMDILDLIVCKPLSVASVTNASLFRTVEMTQPTLLADEADTYLPENDELRGALNAGHKRGGQVIRCVGDAAEPRLFSVFSPAAIACIGHLPGTLVDRAINIRMHRCTRDERPKKSLDGQAVKEGAELARKAARWCQDNADRVQEEPILPPELFNRSADNWRPLFALAAVVGGDWYARLAKAAALLTPDDDTESLGIKLLTDIKTVLANCDQISSKELTEKLNAIETSPWAEVSKGKPLTQNRLASLLKPYRALGCFAKDVWVGNPPRSLMGYKKVDFGEAWRRYLPPDPPNEVRESESPRETSGLEDSEVREGEGGLGLQNQRSPASNAASRTLGLQNPLPEGNGLDSPPPDGIEAAIEARAHELMAENERSGAVKFTDREKALDYYRGSARREAMASPDARRLWAAATKPRAPVVTEEEAFNEIEAMRREFGGE